MLIKLPNMTLLKGRRHKKIADLKNKDGSGVKKPH